MLSSDLSESDFVVALDFGGTKIDVAVADLRGQLLEQCRLPTEAHHGAEQAMQRALHAARSLVSSAVERRGGRCVAVGAVSPGVILSDRVLLSPNIPGWERVALRERLCEELGIACVAVGNDVKAAALAEARWGQLSGADPAVYLSLGTGIASALVIGGRVLHGAHQASGEIGYNLRMRAGEVGFAGGHAPLEEAVGGRAIGERGSHLLGRELDAAEVFATRDTRARQVIDEALDELSAHIANLAILIDPARIVVGGGMMSASERILDALTSRLKTAVPFPPQIVAACFAQDASLRGAVALALDATQALANGLLGQRRKYYERNIDGC